MPVISVPFPSVTISTHRTYRDARALLAAQTGSAAIAAPADDWVAELKSGQKGSAILVQKEEVKSLLSSTICYIPTCYVFLHDDTTFAGYFFLISCLQLEQLLLSTASDGSGNGGVRFGEEKNLTTVLTTKLLPLATVDYQITPK